jgi:hypothetical protein
MANALFMVPNPINNRSTDSVECLSHEIGSWLPKLNFGKPAANSGFAPVILLFWADLGE